MYTIVQNTHYPAWSSFFDDFFNRKLLDWTTRNFSDTNTTLPSVNILEGTDNYEVDMAAPGLEKKDFKIELNHGVLTISSEEKGENETKNGKQFMLRDYSYWSFSRSFTLPDIAESEKILAKYENGVLKVVIPKKDVSKTKSLISKTRLLEKQIPTPPYNF